MGLVIKSNVRKVTELAVSEEFMEAFEKKVEEMLKTAENRAKENSRRTLFARDL
jgi:histone H3/H4